METERQVMTVEELATLVGQTVNCVGIQREPDGSFVTDSRQRYRGVLTREGDRYAVQDTRTVVYIEPDTLLQWQVKRVEG